MFVRAIRAKGDGLGEDHRWSFLLLLQGHPSPSPSLSLSLSRLHLKIPILTTTPPVPHPPHLLVVIWAAVSAISKWRQALHRRSRVQGFLRFYKETLLLRKMPFVIVSSGWSSQPTLR